MNDSDKNKIDVQALYDKGVEYFKSLEYEKAFHCFDKAIKLNGMAASPWHRKGNVYFALKEYKKALACFDKAIELDGTLVGPLYGKGQIYSYLKEYKKALVCYDKAIELDETSASPWYGKGEVYFDLKEYEKALVCYDKAIELDDTFAYPRYGKGEVYFDLKEYEKALVCYDKAIELDDTFAYPWDGKGNVYSDLKEYKKALVCYDKAIELDGVLAGPWDGKGIVLKKLDKIPEAGICFRRFVYLADSQEVLKNINHIIDFFQNHIYAPFFVLRLAMEYPQFDDMISWKKIASGVYNECSGIYQIIEYLTHTLLPVDPLRYYKLLGIINYYMGDSIAGFNYFDQKADTGETPLGVRADYYFILASLDFDESTGDLLRFALEDAGGVLASGKSNQDDYYYAGHIFLLNEEFDKALECFSKEKDHLPSLYMKILVYSRCNNTKKKEKAIEAVLNKEKELQVTGRGFINKIEFMIIDCTVDNFEQELFNYFHFMEIFPAFREIDIFLCSNPHPQWKFVDLQTEKLGLNKVWKLPGHQIAEMENIKHEKNHKELKKLKIYFLEEFESKFKEWTGINNKDKLAKELGEYLYAHSGNSDSVHKLVFYFYYTGAINPKDTLLLHYFIEARKYWNKGNKITTAAAKEGLKKVMYYSGVFALGTILVPQLSDVTRIFLHAGSAAGVELLLRFFHSRKTSVF